MSFLRPEARATLWRWREPLAALGLIGVGAWVAFRRSLLIPELGWVLMGIGAVVFLVALNRLRFARSGDGPGVVDLIEGRVRYMGPYYGGAISLDELTALSLRRASDGKNYWVLAEADSVLVIPVEASGADVLFDAFIRLPGLTSARLLAALDRSDPGTVTLWRSRPLPALT